MNRIAVILRGHLRTWNYLKPAIFDFYKNISNNVDYYFVTWRVPNLNEYQLLNDFKDKNLIKLLILTPPTGPESFYSSWGGPAYLSFHIAPYVRQRQKQITYDAIIETRPDIAYSLNENYPIIIPELKSIYTPSLSSILYDNDIYIATSDFFFVMSPDVFAITSDRIALETSILGSHYDYIKMFIDNNINICSLRWIKPVISRPNGIENVPDPKDYINSTPANFFYQWGTMNEEQKMHYVIKYNLNEYDYMNSDNPFARIR